MSVSLNIFSAQELTIDEAGLEFKITTLGYLHRSKRAGKQQRFGACRRLKTLKKHVTKLKSQKSKCFFEIGSGYPSAPNKFQGWYEIIFKHSSGSCFNQFLN